MRRTRARHRPRVSSRRPVAARRVAAPTASHGARCSLGLSTSRDATDADWAFPVLKTLRAQVLRVNLYWGGPDRRRAKQRPTNAHNPADPAYDWTPLRPRRQVRGEEQDQDPFSILGTPGWANGGKAALRADERADLRNFAVRGGQALQRHLHPTRTAVRSRPYALDGVERAEQPGLPEAAVPAHRASATSIAERSTTPKICNAIYAGVHPTLIKGEKVACGVDRPARQQPANAAAAVHVAAVFMRGGEEGRLRTSTRRRTTRTTQPERDADDEAARGAARVTLGNINDADRAADAALGPQAHLDHRVRLPDEPARPQSSASPGPSRRGT